MTSRLRRGHSGVSIFKFSTPNHPARRWSSSLIFCWVSRLP
jgi:hypothetical protein